MNPLPGETWENNRSGSEVQIHSMDFEYAPMLRGQSIYVGWGGVDSWAKAFADIPEESNIVVFRLRERLWAISLDDFTSRFTKVNTEAV